MIYRCSLRLNKKCITYFYSSYSFSFTRGSHCVVVPRFGHYVKLALFLLVLLVTLRKEVYEHFLLRSGGQQLPWALIACSSEPFKNRMFCLVSTFTYILTHCPMEKHFPQCTKCRQSSSAAVSLSLCCIYRSVLCRNGEMLLGVDKVSFGEPK